MLSSQVFEPFQTPAQPFLSLICKMTKRRWTADATTVPHYSEYLSTPYWRQERQKTTAREECEPRSRAEPKLKREMDEQLHKHNGRFRIHRVETQTEPQKSGRRGEQQLPQQRPKKATHNTPKTPVWWPVRTTQAEHNCEGSRLTSVLQNYCLISISVTVFQYVVKTFKCSCCAINLMSVQDEQGTSQTPLTS